MNQHFYRCKKHLILTVVFILNPWGALYSWDQDYVFLWAKLIKAPIIAETILSRAHTTKITVKSQYYNHYKKKHHR